MTRHRFEPFAFCAGALFIVLAVVFALDAAEVWSTDASWVPPVVLIAFGSAGVLATITRRRAHTDDEARLTSDP
jgi:hypothetical protein